MRLRPFSVNELTYKNTYSLLALCPEDGQSTFELVEQKTIFNPSRNTEID